MNMDLILSLATRRKLKGCRRPHEIAICQPEESSEPSKGKRIINLADSAPALHRVHFTTPSHCAMAGPLGNYQLNVHVGPSSQLSMPFHAPKGGFHPSDTTKYGI